MSEPAHAIAIPRSSDPLSSTSAFTFESIFSPNSMTSPISISSPFSASSGSRSAGQASATSVGEANAGSGLMLASSFATTISAFSDASPTRGDGDDKISVATTSKIDTDAQSSVGTEEQGVVKKHKPHKCDVCGACFARKVHLQRHSLRHQVCKPYCCDRCSKCFSRQDSLVRHHRLLHEKAKPDKKAGNAEKGKNVAPVCVRCSSIAVPCDGGQPCGRCQANHGGESCVYAPTSLPLTIGAATAKSLKRARKQQKMKQKHGDHEVASPSESDAQSWATFARGGRRDTVSSAASGWSEASTTSPFQHDSEGAVFNAWNLHQMQNAMPPLYGQQQQLQQWQLQQLDAQQIDTNHGGQTLHPFDMSRLHSVEQMSASANMSNSLGQTLAHTHTDTMDMDGAQDTLMPQLLSLIGVSGQETPMPRGQGSQNAAAALQNIDWNSMLQHLQQTSQNALQQGDHSTFNGFDMDSHIANDAARMPFNGTASIKGMNATLFNAMDQSGSSNYSSPMPGQNGMQGIEPDMQPHQTLPGNDVVSLASLGIPVPPLLNISLPANLQMSADNWDNLMRYVSHAMTQPQNAAAGATNGGMPPHLGGMHTDPSTEHTATAS